MRHKLISSCRDWGILVLLLLLVQSLSWSEAVAQPTVCPDENYTLTTQAAVDAFPQGCTEVSGNLTIGVSEDISDLSALSAVTSVAGTLDIRYNEVLMNLDGLSSLTSVGGNLYVGHDIPWWAGASGTNLTNLDGLSALTSVGGDLLVRYNNNLTDLHGLAGLVSVGGALAIVYSTALSTLDGLSALSTVGALSVGDDPALTNIDGLSGLTEIRGDLSIQNNPLLTDLNGLSGVTYLGWALTVKENSALTNLDGLSGITGSVESSIRIEYNRVLANLDGLSGLITIRGSLGLAGNDALANVDGLSGLTTIAGSFWLGGNDALANLDGLSALTSVAGGLGIDGNDALTNLDGLSALSTVGGLSVFHNNALLDIDGLSGLTSVGGLGIGDNGALTNLDGLSGITGPIGGGLSISQNGALTNLDGLSGITSVGGSLNIEGNDVLTNLDGLSGITSVGGPYLYDALRISDNDALTNLDGLSGIRSASVSYLDIFGNKVLTSCSCGLYTCVSRECAEEWVRMSGNAEFGDCNNDGADLVANECTAPPGGVTLSSPVDSAGGVASYLKLLWDATPGADRYHLQVDLSGTFSSPLVNDSTLTETSFTPSEPFSYSTTYYWRVRAGLDNGVSKATDLLFGPWSETRSFTIALGTATEGGSDIPTSFALHPNYPNPFNPSTTITFDVPKASTVRLAVFDALGRQVEELGTWNPSTGSGQALAPGTHSVTWNASGRPSGMYFVRMEAGDFTETRRMILVK